MPKKKTIKVPTTGVCDFETLVTSKRGKYADKWIGGKRPVTLIGINFNPKKRNIDMPIVEPA